MSVFLLQQFVFSVASRGPAEADKFVASHGFRFSGTYRWVPPRALSSL